MSSAAVALILSLCAFAQKPGTAPYVVTRNCSGCHGVAGNAPLPYIPRLAGLSAAYLESRIRAFQATPPPPTDELLHWITAPRAAHWNGSKDDNAAIHMVGIAHAITSEECAAATAWYARQTAAPGRAGNLELVEKGKVLFVNGVAAQHVPACRSCHGEQAEGTARAPHLAGQNGSYVLSRLARFRAENRQPTSVMTSIAQQLGSDQCRVLAAYLQSR